MIENSPEYKRLRGDLIEMLMMSEEFNRVDKEKQLPLMEVENKELQFYNLSWSI